MRKATYHRLRTTAITLVSITLIGSLLYIYFYTGFFTLQNYSLEGVPDGYAEELDKDIRLIAENKLFYILPGNRSISYHDDDIRLLINETLPNTKSISIHPSGLHTLSIKLTPYEPLFSVSDTHAIAKDGTVYKEIVPVTDFPRLEVASSSSVHPRVLVSVADLITKINSVLFTVRYVDVDEFNDIRLYDESKRTAVIIASDANMDTVWSNTLSAIDTEPLKSKLSDSKERMEYLDTRFGNKVFYKFTNASIPAIIPEPNDQVATTTISSH